ncbi:MAG: hypothetical protein COW19_01050 [Zetaproteobacteria bacterium CG12_big_fil_rev_8_21_14_0_65_55_1124]|nr:MAG: hypothetical protein AUJ58_08645 [Zetaproteobacteria bacterium CG1_02_55_237]PIS20461.1 MAG: hypothetical protein COT53_00100 [Zetaproteobacteria bacterium CG08_land_8_20_14_0_20_55_17]PIW43740.1 MAG: hypothetical protein COW19_01050 [Zetaproteobacteria bacterium CG12_big_fil_rev_8_21_14_0_65_55_1124]PIY53276.1 MAG: hypothetical protein COZ01_04255 [Zetaproteobacteria bacterium CG_4_10_14_0_8_um_filter_55_43]PIZ40152.1 MAG: hypothetical protein COY36_00720 [Zetaproteobacteria bacterium 
MSTAKKLTKKDLTDLARELGIKNAAKAKKEDLIHAIQTAEGNDACFGRIPNCAVTPCLFRADCIG